MDKTLKLSDLKCGDVMLFEAPPEPLSQLIAKLTHSKVSHAGLSDYNPAYVLNEEIDGVVRAPLHTNNERGIYIRRLTRKEGQDITYPDTKIVADIATKYAEEKLPYGKFNLAVLGLYILGYNFAEDSKYRDLILSVIKIAIFEVIKLVDKKYYDDPDVHPMVCSQFAAHCYDEAFKVKGLDYKIRYTEEVTSGQNLLKEIIDYIKEHIADLFKRTPEMLLETSENVAVNRDEKIMALLDKIKEDEAYNRVDKVSSVKSFISEELIRMFYIYGRHLLKLSGNKKEYKDITKEDVSGQELLSLFNDLLLFQETFITPEDLLSHTENLEDMGKLVYTPEEIEVYLKQ